MHQSYSDRDSRGRSQENSGLSTRGRMIFWLVMLGLVGLMCGCMAGMFLPTVFPPVANLAAPLACINGTLEAQPASASTSYSVAFRTRFWCTDSATRVRNDVSTPVLYVSAVIFALVLVIVLVVVMAFVEGVRDLQARSISG